jgi:pantetheine-phosphate adenylyltransferase
MRKAVYAGSFDILTHGHWWMIEQGIMLFDHLHVAIGVNPDKRGKEYFTVEEREEAIRECLETHLIPNSRVTVEAYESKYLIHHARAVGCNYLLRGLRSEGDFAYERVMRNFNGDMDKGIMTVFLMPHRDIAEVSSSFVKGLIGPDGWPHAVYRYVPLCVYNRIIDKEKARRA